MTTRRVLTDEMWARLEPLLPDRTPRPGGRWRDHRDVLETIIWRFRTGPPWRDLPADFGSYQTVWWRFDRWAKDGTLGRVLTELQGQAQAAADLEWVVSVDSTIARAHQHAAGAPRVLRGARANYTVSWPEPDDHARGHSRGGWTTKAHVAVDARGRPLAIRLTPGQAGGNPEMLPILQEISVPTGHRPRSRPDAVVADKAYSHGSTRTALRGRGIRTVIPPRSDQIALRARRGRRGGRPLDFDSAAYRGRNVVERDFCTLKSRRGIASRSDKHARNYRAGLVLVAIVLFWL